MTSFLQTMLEASGSTRTYLYMNSQNPRVAPTPTDPPPHHWGYVALSDIPPVLPGDPWWPHEILQGVSPNSPLISPLPSPHHMLTTSICEMEIIYFHKAGLGN